MRDAISYALRAFILTYLMCAADPAGAQPCQPHTRRIAPLARTFRETERTNRISATSWLCRGAATPHHLRHVMQL
jgi:hypothetical protein